MISLDAAIVIWHDVRRCVANRICRICRPRLTHPDVSRRSALRSQPGSQGSERDRWALPVATLGEFWSIQGTASLCFAAGQVKARPTAEPIAASTARGGRGTSALRLEPRALVLAHPLDRKKDFLHLPFKHHPTQRKLTLTTAFKGDCSDGVWNYRDPWK